MKRKLIVIGALGSLIILSAVWLASPSFEVVEKCSQVAREPNISPEYAGIVMPSNIAPLNFRILEKGQAYCVKIHSDSGPALEIASKTGRICIPQRKWRALLDANKGRELFVDVYVRNAENEWLQFRRITNTVAKEDIDRTVAISIFAAAPSCGRTETPFHLRTTTSSNMTLGG